MIKLLHGDCLELMKDILINEYIIVTDPPFNIRYKYNSYKDNMDETEYYQMLVELLYPFPHVIIHYPEALYKYSFAAGIFPERVISWVYNSNTPRQHRDIAFFRILPDFTKCGQPYKNITDKRIRKKILEGKTAKLYDWWEINQVKNVSYDKTEHPCQMPVEVMERIIKILPNNKTIIDPFMGSGSTGIACKNLNRDFIGIEKDDKYFEIAKNRIENHTPQMELIGAINDTT